MDIGSIAAAASSLKIAGEIAAGLIELKTTTEVQSKAIELNQKLITAQHEIFAANEGVKSTLDACSLIMEKQIQPCSSADS